MLRDSAGAANTPWFDRAWMAVQGRNHEPVTATLRGVGHAVLTRPTVVLALYRAMADSGLACDTHYIHIVHPRREPLVVRCVCARALAASPSFSASGGRIRVEGVWGRAQLLLDAAGVHTRRLRLQGCATVDKARGRFLAQASARSHQSQQHALVPGRGGCRAADHRVL